MAQRKESNYKLSEYKKNTENPFLEEAVDLIQNNIVKKYKNTAGYGEKAVLKAVDPETGEILGHTTFIRQIKVDEEKFTKVYLSQFSAFWELKSQAIKVFGYIMTKLIPKQDMFIFLEHECLNYTGYKSQASIRIGLGSLVANQIIARGPSDTLYFINPMVAFNGDRVTFAQTYIKNQKLKIKKESPVVNPNQTNLLDQIEEMENE
ncbi:MAG: RepA protein [Polaribacter sp.]